MPSPDNETKRRRAHRATLAAASVLIAVGSMVTFGAAPASASAAAYCGQGWTDYDTGSGIMWITSGLRTGPLYGCASNGLAYEGDPVVVDCYDSATGWLFVEDPTRGNRGWVPIGNVALYSGTTFGYC